MIIKVQRDNASELASKKEHKENENDEREITNSRVQYRSTIKTLFVLCIGLMSFVAFVLIKQYNNPKEMILNPDKRQILSDTAANDVFSAYKEVWKEKGYSHTFLLNELEHNLESQDLQLVAKDRFESQFDELQDKKYILVSIGSSTTQTFLVKQGSVKAENIEGSDDFGVSNESSVTKVNKFVSGLKQVKDEFDQEGGKSPIIFFNAIGYGANEIVDNPLHMIEIGKSAPNYGDYRLRIETSSSNTVILIKQLHAALVAEGISDAMVKPRMAPKIEIHWARRFGIANNEPVIAIDGSKSFNIHFPIDQRCIEYKASYDTDEIFRTVMQTVQSGDDATERGKELANSIISNFENAARQAGVLKANWKTVRAVQTGEMRNKFYNMHRSKDGQMGHMDFNTTIWSK